MHENGLQPQRALYAAYANRPQNRGMALESLAIRTQSTAIRDLFAHLATDGRMSARQVTASVHAGTLVNFDANWLARLARVAALQGLDPGDITFARQALKLARPALRSMRLSPRRFRKLEVELAILERDFFEAQALLTNDPGLAEQHTYLAAELQNPFIQSPFHDRNSWLESLSAPFVRHGVEPVSLLDRDLSPFDRLEVPDVPPGTVDGPLVTVLITAYRPDFQALSTSLRSILAQSWANLQILLIDDASGPEYDETLRVLSNLDQRVELIRLRSNGGTYLARNAGLLAARGQFITGQDSDDWSHPRRIEYQVERLLENTNAPGVRVAGMSVSDDLQRVRLGYTPEGPNASSLMYRAELGKELGGYVPARKAADNEFHQRLERYTAAAVIESPALLTAIRVQSNSLSRGEFRAGWSHPARRMFKSAYIHWHTTGTTPEFRLTSAGTQPFAIPNRFRIHGEPPLELDVLYAGDFRTYGIEQRAMVEEILAAVGSGHQVGILHLESPWPISHQKLLHPQIQGLVNDGVVTQVLQDEPAKTRLTVLRDPAILQFPQHAPLAIETERLLIVTSDAPGEINTERPRYLASDCSSNAVRLFGRDPLWVPETPHIRDAISAAVPESELADFEMPQIVDVDRWRTVRTHYRSSVPVLGARLQESTTVPAVDSALPLKLPSDGSIDIRALSRASALGSSSKPHYHLASWAIFDAAEMPLRTFFNSVDFYAGYNFVVDPGDIRDTLEAISTGCIAILPPALERTFGPSAVYCDSNELTSTVWDYYANRSAYQEQVDTALHHVQAHFSYGAYQARLRTILSAASTHDLSVAVSRREVVESTHSTE